MSCWDKIEAIYYINLSYRTDRLLQIESEFDRLNIPVLKRIRVEAVRTAYCGALGCCQSHVKALEMFLESGGSYAIIMEDDFQFTEDPEKYISTALALPFDVVMLAGSFKCVDTQHSNIKIIFDAQTTAGYLITREFAVKLCAHWRKTAWLIQRHLEAYGEHSWLLACDQTWKALQYNQKWFAILPKLGKQREGFSDIEMKTVDYGV